MLGVVWAAAAAQIECVGMLGVVWAAAFVAMAYAQRSCAVPEPAMHSSSSSSSLEEHDDVRTTRPRQGFKRR